MLIDYKMQKVMAFGLAGLVPVMVFTMLSFFRFDLLLGMILTLLVGGFLAFVGHKITSMHPIIRAVQEGKVLIIDTPSTGVANLYCAEVLKNDLGDGIDIRTDTGDVRAYDRIITNLMSSPFLAKIGFKKNKEEPEKNKISIELTNSEFKQAAWFYQNLTLLFYNSQVGSFITKPQMSIQEKEMLAEYLSLNEARELRQLNKTFLLLMRHTFDLIADRFSRILGNPMFQVIVVGVILIVLGYLALQFVPGLTGATSNAVNNIGGSLATPLTILGE